MTNYFKTPDSLVDAVNVVLRGEKYEPIEEMGPMKAPQRGSTRKMSKKEREADKKKGLDWPEEVKEKKLDPVDPKELKGKHSERDDKDIDNDGDSDSSDEYLHKRRKAIFKNQVQTAKEQFEDDPEFLEIYLEALHMMEQNVVLRGETLDEMKQKFALVDKDNIVVSTGSDERDLKLNRPSLQRKFGELKLVQIKKNQDIGYPVKK